MHRTPFHPRKKAEIYQKKAEKGQDFLKKGCNGETSLENIIAFPSITSIIGGGDVREFPEGAMEGLPG
jgi:hypothetical protein